MREKGFHNVLQPPTARSSPTASRMDEIEYTTMPELMEKHKGNHGCTRRVSPFIGGLRVPFIRFPSKPE